MLMMLSDEDIQAKIQIQDVVITNFEEESLTAVGYDLRIGGKGFSWKKHQDFAIARGNPLRIEPYDTVVVETYESIRLSKNISGTLHATATLTLRRGLSHISTTVDPGWTGKLLISLHNNLDTAVELNFKDIFCTICLYQLQSKARKDVGRPPNRKDVWDELLDRARAEKDRLEEVKRKEKEEQARRKKFLAVSRVSIFLIILFSGWISSKYIEPSQAAIIMAALTAAVVLLPDVLKP